MSSARKISIVPLLVVSFIGTLGYSIVLPSLVYIVQRFKGGDFLYGAIGATYSAFQLVGSPLLGNLSDKFGRKKILFLSAFGSTVAWALFILALSIPVTTIASFSTTFTGVAIITLPMLCLFIARAVDGLTAGDVSVANAYVADIATSAERKADFGKMGVAANLGFVIGPVLAGVLAGTTLGLRLPILAALGTSLLALVLIIWALPESHPRAIEQPLEACDGIRKNLGHAAKDSYHIAPRKRMNLRAALALDHIPLLLAIYFIFFLAFSLFVAAMPLYATERLHWSVAEMGIFFSVLSIVMVITEGPVLSRLSKLVSAEALTIWGTLVVALGYIVLLIPTALTAYSAAVLYAIGNGLMWPSFLSLLSDRAGDDNQGYIQGIGNSAGSLASIVGLFVGGALFTHLGEQIFWVPAGLVTIVFVMSFWLRRGSEP
ncbi:MAG TPA: MFS transporter [Candidatus Kapabacteria bacterium]|nr:MFS transporter [Candidatus Kapabacteria bacterium]